MKKKASSLLKRKRGITDNTFAPKNLKPQKSRKLIRRYHVLLKRKQLLLNKLGWDDKHEIPKELKSTYEAGKINEPFDDKLTIGELTQKELVEKLGRIDGEIAKNGGIELYQSASKQGQDKQRGGDSSKKLVEWLQTDHYSTKLAKDAVALEIGCLSPFNLISTSRIFQHVTKIDLHSQHHLILEQDFMDRPLPKSSDEKFDLISCSLVLNFVATPAQRGEMLQRITKFLKAPGTNALSTLFLVLPLPCITNSRYFTNDILQELMKSLGFVQVYFYEAKKVAYWLFDWNGKGTHRPRIKKTEVRPGPNRNNFCITLNA